MQLGMVGLGRMGASMVRRLVNHGNTCIVHDTRPEAMTSLCKLGAVGATLIEDLITKMEPPRAIWLMVPAHVLTTALYERFASRGEAGFANRLLSAMRHEFGGHVEKPPEASE